jgi:hypothetical protein
MIVHYQKQKEVKNRAKSRVTFLMQLSENAARNEPIITASY